MSYMNVEGSRIHYVRYPGEGPTLVLIHAWSASSRSWDGVVSSRRAAGLDTVTVDLRGCGRSDKDFLDTSIDTLGGDIVRLTEELGLDQVILNGWSIGGAVAVDAAAKLGPKVVGLILTAGASPRMTRSPDWVHGAPPESIEQMLEGVAENRPATLRAMADAMCSVDIGQPARDALWLSMLDAAPCIDGALRDILSLDQRAAAKAISAPVLLMAGKNDAFVSFDASEAAALAFGQHAQLVAFEDSGHAPFLEEPVKYLMELEKFMKVV